MGRNRVRLVACLGGISFFCGVSSASAQTPPSLGAAQSFAVLGGGSVTAAGAGTVITGDVGVSPGVSITGSITVVPPYSTHQTDGPANAAQTSATALYLDLANRVGATPLLPELGGTQVPPGVYSFTSTANIANNTSLILNGAGIYIFQVASAITANTGSNVLLQNGASPCNVFWQVTSAATLNGVNFVGTVVAQAAVTLGPSAALNGRALTTSLGDVTMAGGNTVGGCAATPACPLITIAPPTVPNGTLGTAYSQTLTASGGTGPYTFSVVSGTLPAGLTLTAGGVLSGTPTTVGTTTITIRATDVNGCFAQITYTIVISASGCPVVVISPSTMPNGTFGVPYSQTLTASGGSGPFTFSVVSGTLPAGLTLTAGGVLSGTPTTVGSSTFVVQVTNGTSCPGAITYTINIVTAVPTLPQAFVLFLVLGLAGVGWLRLRQRARVD
jgi:hypothetical protein